MFWSILEVIAFVSIGSKFATVRTLLPLHRRIGAYTALARARNVGEASLARLASPTSRRGITEQWELSLPLQRRECFFDGHPKRLLGINSTLQVESGHRGKPVSCGIEESPTGETTDSTRAEFVGADRLFARLVLHQVRLRDCSVAAVKQPIGSSHNRKPGLVSVPPPDTGSSFTLRSERLVMTAPATLLDPLSIPIETLFSELARRRLRRLAAKERP